MSQFIEKTEPSGIVMYIAVSAVIGILMVTGQFTAISLRGEVKELRKRIDTLEVRFENVANSR